MLEPILITTIKKFEDNRGFFYESYKENFLAEEYGITKKFVQDNHSVSKFGVIRGMHYQWDKPMDKLVRVSKGKIIDILVDIRIKSPNLGKVYFYELSEENNHQLWVPAGFAHGFTALSDEAHVQYKCTELYNKNGESGLNPIRFFSQFISTDIIISDKDKESEDFSEYLKHPKF